MQDGFREGRGKAQGVLACIGCGDVQTRSTAVQRQQRAALSSSALLCSTTHPNMLHALHCRLPLSAAHLAGMSPPSSE